jgi:hypothetical protein
MTLLNELKQHIKQKNGHELSRQATTESKSEKEVEIVESEQLEEEKEETIKPIFETETNIETLKSDSALKSFLKYVCTFKIQF